MEALAIDPSLDLANLMTREIPEGRQSLIDSHANLERVAEYCQENYLQVCLFVTMPWEMMIFFPPSTGIRTRVALVALFRLHVDVLTSGAETGQTSQARRDEELHGTEPCQRGLPDQLAGLQLSADARPAAGATGPHGVAGHAHRAVGEHPQGEGCPPGDRRADREQDVEPAVQDHRAGQPRTADQVREEAHRLLV